MLELYDRLIEGIPSDWRAEQVFAGRHYAMVRSCAGIGLSEVKTYEFRRPVSNNILVGSSLRDVAALIRSWNFVEASIGLAAINAYYNALAIARENGVAISDSQHAEDRIYDPFLMGQNEVKGKKVTILGHFPHILKLIGPVCDLRIIGVETPIDDDYPLSAAPYLIQESDYVFLGSSSIIDKSLPLFLKMAEKAIKVTIVGPSTTLAPALFEFGVKDLSGFVVKNESKALGIVFGYDNAKIFSAGQKVAFKIDQNKKETKNAG